MITNMTLSTPPISPLVTTLKKHQDDPTSFPRNSSHLNQQQQQQQQHSSYLNHNTSVTSSPSLFASLSISTMARKAMSVMSSTSSYQYFGTLDHESEQENGGDGGGDGTSTFAHPVSTGPEDYDDLSKHDLASVMDTHQTLLVAAQAYREQLAQLSIASANFGIALETVAKHKASMDAGQGLQAAAGLQLLISNHHQILAESIRKTFETPLAAQIEEHQSTIKESQENYDMALRMVSNTIREKEDANLRQAKRGQRDLGQYKRTLKELTRQVDELDYIKTTYHQRMQQIERHYHQDILHQTGWLVRAQVDVYELLASKGLGDSTLETMIQQHPDPFNSYETINDSRHGTTTSANDLFTVLPINSLIAPLPTSHSNTIMITTTTSHEHNGNRQEHDLDQDVQSLDDIGLTVGPTPTLTASCFDHLQQQQQQQSVPFLYKQPSTDSFHRHIQQQQQQLHDHDHLSQRNRSSTSSLPLIKVPDNNDDISIAHDNKLDFDQHPETTRIRLDGEWQQQQQPVKTTTTRISESSSNSSGSSSDEDTHWTNIR